MGIMKFCQVQGLCYLTMLRKTHRKTMGIVKFCQVLGHALHEKYRASRLGLYLRQYEPQIAQICTDFLKKDNGMRALRARVSRVGGRLPGV